MLAAASAAFLTKNFHPARIFLGDVGFGAVSDFSPRCSDSWAGMTASGRSGFRCLCSRRSFAMRLLTLLKRLLRRERVWQAHREHYYQRLVRMGFGHRGAAYIEYTAMLGCAAAALSARDAAEGVQVVTLVAATAALVTIAVSIDVRWARHRRQSPGGGA